MNCLAKLLNCIKVKSLFGAFSRKKKRSVDEDEGEAEDNSEEMQEDQEAVETGEMIEAAVNSDRNSVQIQGLQNIMNDSNTHPIQYGGLDLCGLADSLLKKLSPLDQLTENEINAIRAKIEDHEIVVAIGKRQKNKSLVKLGSSIIDYIDQKCWCTSFQSKRYQRKK